MIVNNATLLNSNLYKQMVISSGKNGLLVKVGNNIFNKKTDDFKYFYKKFFDKPKNNILDGIELKSEFEQLDTVISFFARNNTINEIDVMGPIVFRGSSQSLSLKGRLKYDDIYKKLLKKYNEDRIRFYGKNGNCIHYQIDTSWYTTGFSKENGKICFCLKEADIKKFGEPIRIVPTDEKFLDIFLREQVINKNGDVIIERREHDFSLTIDNVEITYDEDLYLFFNSALRKREERIQNEKIMQYKLDI